MNNASMIEMWAEGYKLSVVGIVEIVKGLEMALVSVNKGTLDRTRL